MITKPIVLPARSNAKLAFVLPGDIDTTALWVEIKRSLDDQGARFEGVLLDALTRKWLVSISSDFSSVNRGQKWFAVVCVPGENGADELAYLPISFGIDTDYEPAQYNLIRNELGEIHIHVERLVLPVGVPGAIQLPALTAIHLGRLVMATTGGATLYDSHQASHAYRLAGLALTSASIGDSVAIQPEGKVTIPGWGLVAGTVYYAGSNGELTPGPDWSGAFIQVIGQAIDSDSLQLAEDDPLFI